MTLLENDAKFECEYPSISAHGTSNIKTVSLSKDNILIHIKNSTGDFSFGDYVGRIKPISVVDSISTIQLEKATFNDNGEYSCTVETALNGTEIAKDKLLVKCKSVLFFTYLGTKDKYTILYKESSLYTNK